MAIEAIGFDLDGTLVDSAQGLGNTVDGMCKRLGLPQPGKALVTTWIGNGIEMLLTRALAWAGAPSDDEYRARAMAILSDCYQDELLSGSPLFPEVKVTLEALKAQGYDLVLITNKPSKFVPELMHYLGIDHLFTEMLGANDVARIKPHPAPIFKILGQLGLTQREFVFVGDSRNDILAAKNAGVRSIALTYGYNYGESIAHASPDAVVDDFAAILPVIETWKND